MGFVICFEIRYFGTELYQDISTRSHSQERFGVGNVRMRLTSSAHHARWQWCESQEQATTLQSIFLKSFMCSLKAIISVGHTKVLCVCVRVCGGGGEWGRGGGGSNRELAHLNTRDEQGGSLPA